MRYKLLGLLTLLLLTGCQSIRPFIATPTPEPEAIDTRLVVPPGARVIHNGLLITEADKPPVEDGIVVIQGEKIFATGQAEDFDIPPGTQTIDAGGGTILPGLIDAHTHGTAYPLVRSLFLTQGVTSVCDTGSPLILMEQFAAGESASGPSARGFTSGPMLTTPDGYPGRASGFAVSYEVDGVDQAAASVGMLFEQGADYIKIALEGGESDSLVPLLNPGQVQAVTTAAHERGLRVRAHISSLEAFQTAVENGVDVIEHLPMVGWSNFGDLEAVFTQAAQQGVILTPTLDALAGEWYGQQDLNTQEAQQYDAILQMVGRYAQLGGKIALGNDYGTPQVDAGLPWREIELLQAAGLSEAEVLLSATRTAAEACGQGNLLGTLEAGKLADILIVEGNPTTDLQALKQVRMVILGGNVVFESQ